MILLNSEKQCIEGGGGGWWEGGGGGGFFRCNYDSHRNLPYFPYHFTIFFCIFQILSLFNLGLFLIFHIISQFNLGFFHIFHILSLFNLPFFHIFPIFSLLYPPQQSCSGVYWFHHVRPSVRLSVRL